MSETPSCITAIHSEFDLKIKYNQNALRGCDWGRQGGGALCKTPAWKDMGDPQHRPSTEGVGLDCNEVISGSSTLSVARS